MAVSCGMVPAEFERTVRDTCGCKGASPEQFAAFLLVAREYGLNPLVKEIYAFPSKGGGIQPIVSIDGWLRMANDHEQFDGIEHHDHLDDSGNLVSITARLYRKDRSHPTTVTEYLTECRQGTEPWKKWPARMLRHKATIQAIRYGLGFSGIVDPDEAERIAPAAVTVEYRPKGEKTAKAVTVESLVERQAEVDRKAAGTADGAAFVAAIAAAQTAADLDVCDSIRRKLDTTKNAGRITDAEFQDVVQALQHRANQLIAQQEGN
jgi:phage recombination protein Bet